MPKIFVLNVPEFEGLIREARLREDYSVTDTGIGYTEIGHDAELVFNRSKVGFWPAIWYAALCAGFEGDIAEYGRDTLRIVARRS